MTNLSKQVHIIAEAGSNHNGNPDLAKKLISSAVYANADSVKFQIINPESLYLPSYFKNGKQIPSKVFQQRKKEQFSDYIWRSLADYAKELGIIFSASVFDKQGLDLLLSLNPEYLKIASTDLNNVPFLRKIAKIKKPVLLSTGMALLSEIERAVTVFEKESALKSLTLMHCISLYPCPLSEANLNMIDKLQYAFGLPVGFSDHTQGSDAASIAISKGASVIEKHFTMDKTLPGFDHLHALKPDELKAFVTTLRNVETACRHSAAPVSPGENITKKRARRGLYAARDIDPGHVLTPEDILIVRPSAELGPEEYDDLIGRKVCSKIHKNESFGKKFVIGSGKDHSDQAEAYWSDEMKKKGL
ncbi:MAG: N-acetylneuraminate synthase family protein [Desulfobacterales bacterium]